MDPQEFFKLSTATSVAAATAVVLIVTNGLAEFRRHGGAWRRRAGVGVAIAVIVVAMWISPPAGGNPLTIALLGAANVCLLYSGAFLSSRVSRVGAAAAAAAGTSFWEAW